jgi:hypothetical protein
VGHFANRCKLFDEHIDIRELAAQSLNADRRCSITLSIFREKNDDSTQPLAFVYHGTGNMLVYKIEQQRALVRRRS